MMKPEQIALLAWYDGHKRILPWRDIQDPYGTWISETMLQQTRVETVKAYYPRFMAAFPTVQALASAPEEQVLKLWEGLGYYSRARNLHRGARQVVDEFGGILPVDTAALRSIRGIGEYTAGAIASIAYGQAVPAVDGNVIRVVSRLKGIRENVGIPSVRRALAAEAAELVPTERPGDFNQALMDLGSSVCTPGTPDCGSCPLQEHCQAFADGDPEELPVLPRKEPPKPLAYDVILLKGADGLLMRQRTEALLQGLWEYPMLEGHHSLKALPAAIKRKTGLKVDGLRFIGEAKHVFTHRIWQMKLYEAEAEGQPAGAWQFFTPEEMEQLTIPTALKAARKAAFDEIEKQ